MTSERTAQFRYVPSDRRLARSASKRRSPAHCFGAALASLLAAIMVAAAVPAHAADTFQYDPIGRLTQVNYSGGGILAYTYDGLGNILSIVASLATTGVERGAPEAYRFALGRMTPNPGSGPRSIAFSIPTEGNASLRVYDIQGRLVATLFDRDIPAGRYSAKFPSERLASGVYFFRLTHGGRSLTQRMVLIR